MATLQIFMTPEELDKTILDLAVRHSLVGILRTWKGYSPYNPIEQPSQYLIRRKEAVDVYLLPAERLPPSPLSEETFAPRYIGAIQIIPGGLVKSGGAKMLLLTSFSAEDRRVLPFKPAAWLRRFKKRTQAEGSVVFGVEGANTVYGGKDTYEGIGYSATAMELHRKGVVWKQYKDDNSEFSPISGNTA